jgi:hypothetical protein
MRYMRHPGIYCWGKKGEGHAQEKEHDPRFLLFEGGAGKAGEGKRSREKM